MEPSKPDERRREDRTVSVLHVCCIETSFGADFALVRNISGNGAQIEADLPEPVGAMICYTLDDFTRITAKIAWKRDGRIGLVNQSHETVKERRFPRRPIRLPLGLPCRAWIAGSASDARIENISQTGALIAELPDLPVGTPLSLEAASFTLDNLTVRWRKNGKSGVRFPRPLHLNDLNALTGYNRNGIACGRSTERSQDDPRKRFAITGAEFILKRGA